jgi:hypothetical protein
LAIQLSQIVLQYSLLIVHSALPILLGFCSGCPGIAGRRPRSRWRWPRRFGSGSSRGRPSRGSTEPTGRTPSWPSNLYRRTASGPAARPSSGSAAGWTSGFTGRHIASCEANQTSRRRHGWTWPPSKGAEAGELVLLGQDEERFPTLAPTLGAKGHRTVVGTRDCKDLLYVLAVVNVITGVLHANMLESPTRAKQATGKSKTRRTQEAFALHPRRVGRLYQADRHGRVVLIIHNALWHRGGPIDGALADHPHLEFYRLPSYSPQLNVIERFWRPLRRRATHNRLFDGLADLKRSPRASLCYFQTVRGRVRSLVTDCYPAIRTASPGM